MQRIVMGYRELLKKYILHLELTAGDHHIESETREPVLSKRDIGELRTLAAEISRDSYRGEETGRIDNYNYRLRVLMNRHALSADQVSELTAREVDEIRRWRTNPKSARYLEMTAADYAAVEMAVTNWLENTSA